MRVSDVRYQSHLRWEMRENQRHYYGIHLTSQRKRVRRKKYENSVRGKMEIQLEMGGGGIARNSKIKIKQEECD